MEGALPAAIRLLPTISALLKAWLLTGPGQKRPREYEHRRRCCEVFVGGTGTAAPVDASGWCLPEHACAVLSFVFNVDSATEDRRKTKLRIVGQQGKGSLPPARIPHLAPIPKDKHTHRTLARGIYAYRKARPHTGRRGCAL